MAKAPTKIAVPAADRTVTAKDNQPPLEEALRVKHKPIFERLEAWKPKAEKAEKALAKKPLETIQDVEKLEALLIEGRDIANDADTVREKEKAEPFDICKRIDTLFNGGVRDIVGWDEKKGGLAARLRRAAAERRVAIGREEQARAAAEAQRIRQEAEAVNARAAEVTAAGDVKVGAVIANQAEAIHQEADKMAAKAEAPLAEATRSVVAGGGGVRVSADTKMVCTGVVRKDLDLEALRPFLKEDVLIAAVNAVLATGEKTVRGAVIQEQAKSRFGR